MKSSNNKILTSIILCWFKALRKVVRCLFWAFLLNGWPTRSRLWNSQSLCWSRWPAPPVATSSGKTLSEFRFQGPSGSSRTTRSRGRDRRWRLEDWQPASPRFLGTDPTTSRGLLLWGKTSWGRCARGRTLRECTCRRWLCRALKAASRNSLQPCEPVWASCKVVWQFRAARSSCPTWLCRPWSRWSSPWCSSCRSCAGGWRRAGRKCRRPWCPRRTGLCTFSDWHLYSAKKNRFKKFF